jgi:glycosyltransferase involved in cell wall biosynthesis
VTALPSVSVVMPTRGRRAMLRRVLAPLLADPALHEAVVVVDGDVDGSLAELRELAAGDPRLSPVALGGAGRAAARQAGLERAGGDVVLLLDDDVVGEPGLVGAHARRHAQADRLVVVGAMPVPVPEGRAPGRFVQREYARSYADHCDLWARDAAAVLLHLWGGNVSARRADLLAAGGLAPPVRLDYHEDYEIGLRLHDAGLTGVFAPEARATHYHVRGVEAYVAEGAAIGRAWHALRTLRPELEGPTPVEAALPASGSARAAAAALVAAAASDPGRRALVAASGVAGRLRAWDAERRLARLARLGQMRSGLLAGAEPAARAPGVTVCICTRNRPDDLRRALRSLAGSTVPVAHAVVSDDGDDERARPVAEGEGATWVRGPRAGLGANRNHAVLRARTADVLFLDDDAELDERFVERALRAREEPGAPRPGDVIVTGGELNRGELVHPNDQGFLGYQNRVYGRGARRATVVINAALFPRAVFDRVRFDPQLRYGYDEVDVSTRAVAAGWRIVHVPDAVNRHHPSPVNRGEYAPYVEASRLYVTLKRRALTERRPAAALAFGAVAPLHLLAAAARRDGARRGLASWRRSVALAAGYAARHAVARLEGSAR